MLFRSVLLITGIVGIFVSEVMVARDTLKADEIIKKKNFKLPDEAVYYADDRVTVTLVADKKTKVIEEIKATWKCYIPTAISTTLTISAFIASHQLSARQIAALSTAVASAGGLVTKYRDKIREYANEDILHDIDKEIAKGEITKAKPPVVTTSGLMSCEEFDLSEDGEYLFFDPFTRVKFKSTKLAVLGAKYYLNRNFALGACVPLSMFYAFLGLDLPPEYEYAGWDISELADEGYYWIDIDVVKSDDPDPETGKRYYILEYSFLPGETEESYFPFWKPMSQEGSFAV